MKTIKNTEASEFKKDAHIPLSGGFFLTRRCNLDCRHCYIVNKKEGLKELSFDAWKVIFDKFIEMGMLWALLSGGEPLLRPDFSDIYMYLKKRGVLVSVFTNATLINEDVAKMFKEYPPRGLEITVYGSNKEVYERVTQIKGSYEKFINGLNILDKYNIPYTLKAMVMKSNYEDLDNIIKFAESRGCKFDGSIKGFRFDGQLNLRSRKNAKWQKDIEEEEKRNRIIKEERLDIDTLIFLDEKYSLRKEALEKFCEKFYFAPNNDLLFNCGAGLQGFHIDSNGDFQLCIMAEYPNYPLVKENNTKEEIRKI
jgi:MoaA/NifB/PqqE/SkfB family radical SAM enzyme